ncbi:MAG: energy transducer TonB [Bacteroidetes bacterium]|nr:energy transducer TonB [Bacteroidota bacterium]
MQNNEDYFKQSMDDIVFESRNKGYGAYVLRKLYPGIQLKALIAVSLLFILSNLTPSILSQFSANPSINIDRIDTTEIYIMPPSQAYNDQITIPPKGDEQAKSPEPENDLSKTMVAADKDKIKSDQPDNNKDTSKNDGKGGANNGLGDQQVYLPYNVDLPPMYIHGEDALYKWIEDNLTYPEGPRSRGIEGEVIVTFIVEKNGTLTDIKVQGRNDKELEAEAIRIISSTNGKWKPATKRHVAVRSVCKFPISFQF